MEKIKRVSRFFLWLCRFGLVVWPLSAVLYWWHAPDLLLGFMYSAFGLKLTFIPAGMDYPTNLHTSTKLLGFAISLIPVLVVEAILYYLQVLFLNFSQLQVFIIDNSRIVKRIGYALLIGEILQPVYDLLMSANLSWYTAKPVASLSIGLSDLVIILVMLLLFVISWVMEEAYALHAEQKLTV